MATVRDWAAEVDALVAPHVNALNSARMAELREALTRLFGEAVAGCTCGADIPTSARYGHSHLAWCVMAVVPTLHAPADRSAQMKRFLLLPVTRAPHPTIGWAVTAALNELGPSAHVACIIYHPPDKTCTWRDDKGELAEVIVEIKP